MFKFSQLVRQHGHGVVEHTIIWLLWEI